MIPSVPEPPRLPDPGGQYDVRYFAQLLNTLRLYFNRGFLLLQALLSDEGLAYLRTPYIKATSDTTQTAASANTAYAISFPTVAFSNGVTLTSNTQINIPVTGIYLVSVRLQLANSAITVQTVDTWAQVNGTNLANNNRRASVPEQHGGKPGHIALEALTYQALTEGDVVELFWSTDSTSVTLEATAAASSPTRPATPSARLLVHLLSGSVNP